MTPFEFLACRDGEAGFAETATESPRNQRDERTGENKQGRSSCVDV